MGCKNKNWTLNIPCSILDIESGGDHCAIKKRKENIQIQHGISNYQKGKYEQFVGFSCLSKKILK